MSRDTISVPQIEPKVKGEVAEVLSLADRCLKRANFHLARALVNDDPRHWELHGALMRDRSALLTEIGQR